ncbi:class I SAM-dependent methyltransferase [Pelobacter seleniigenes]|uniref:class I SAM-dependent methyltransferase n=1 Tax=Pelobacter seleniigenes TaxID=407188 RepID=UPI00068E3385|nr:methyltransferase domain-containing protein [Pelobacter seleniigenes]
MNLAQNFGHPAAERALLMTKNDSKQRSIESFSKVGDAYVKSETHAKGDDLARLIAIANPQKSWEALDVATGGGHTALALSAYVKKVVATDITPNMLASAEQFVRNQKNVTNIEFKHADAEDLPFEDKTFDLVTCRIAPHHFPECQKFVNEAYRVLRPSGLFVMQDQVLPKNRAAGRLIDDFEQLRDPAHNRAYSEDEWCEMFRSAGFIIEHTECLTKRHEFDKWARRVVDSDAVVQNLIQMVKKAPVEMIDWLAPLPDVASFHLPGSSFINHHLIIAGRK